MDAYLSIGLIYIYSGHIYSGLSCGSAAVRLLGLRVRILRRSWISLSFECCVLSGKVSATGRSLVQRSLTACGGFECDQMQQ